MTWGQPRTDANEPGTACVPSIRPNTQHRTAQRLAQNIAAGVGSYAFNSAFAVRRSVLGLFSSAYVGMGGLGK
jgi:hypothetical protein